MIVLLHGMRIMELLILHLHSDITTSASGAHDVFLIDIDHDGDVDIVSEKNDGTIAWYENNGAADPTWTGTDIDTGALGARSVYVVIWMEMEI